MTEPTTGFAAAGAGLAPLGRDVAAVKTQAQTGTLKLTEDAAQRLLDSLANARKIVTGVLNQRNELHAPLRLGANFIGYTMSERLRDAASGGTSAAIPVLEDLSQVLDDLETTVRAAAGRYAAADDEAKDKLRDANERLGI